MTIGVDGNEANVDQKVGVSEYTSEMLKHFHSVANQNTRFVVYLRTQPNSSLPHTNEFFEYEVVPGRAFWRDVFFPIHLYLHQKIDVLFAPAHYTPRFCPVPVVVTIHDVAYEYYPQEFLKKDLYKLRNWTNHALRQARKVIAVSASAKSDVERFYGKSTSEAKVIYNGFTIFPPESNNSESVLKKFNIEGSKYILAVGTLQPRKNFTTLIRAFKQIASDFPDMKLAIVGKRGWLYDEIFEEARTGPAANRIVFCDFVPDKDLSTLYEQAAVFVLPSLYEGFGIPLLEAMHRGCPSIASETSSLPEVGGDACLYFDPKNTDELAEKLRILLLDKALKKKLSLAGIKQAKKFSWEKSARETLDVIRSAVR